LLVMVFPLSRMQSARRGVIGFSFSFS